ncbi:MAG TPA: response regulator [Pyrinomonadaceae bacterium]|jgi:signal transduction histidine kinase/ActR/RegA family two-component response regulator
MNWQRFAKPYMGAMVFFGGLVVLYSTYHFPFALVDVRFMVLVFITCVITSRISIEVPGLKSQISVSDTIIFLTLLFYGGDAGILLATAEAFCSSLRFAKKKLVIGFNAGATACSTFLMVFVMRLCFGRLNDLSGGFTATFITALCCMALLQYVSNTGLVAIASALKSNQPFWPTWRKYYLWTSITYLAGASAAGIIAKLSNTIGIYALLVGSPIVAIIYFTYLTYLKNVASAATQAEQAERHVEELSCYIAEQERIREQFTQIEKLSALGELASGVAHDFNNTLAGILGRAQLLLRTNDPEKIRRGLQIIIQTAEDGAKTVKRIQDFARQRRDHDFEPVAITQLLQDVSEITRPRWKDRAEAAGIQIALEFQLSSDALVLGEGSELREVLVNMVFNAVDAMPEGGTLTLSTIENDGFAEILISDTGVGMSGDVRSRIFDPFFTTKGKAGLGLGLAVSYGIIRRHEGTVEVESEVGQGTTFRIKLPVAKCASPTLNPSAAPAVFSVETYSPPPARPSDTQRTKILVVDDEAPVRELLRDILESEGYEVVLATDGRDALERLCVETFDGIFTDIGMPGMNGWELARAIREQNISAPLAVITGWGDVVGSSEQKAAQVDWVVTKPFSATRVVELAQEISRRQTETRHRHALTIAA